MKLSKEEALVLAKLLNAVENAGAPVVYGESSSGLVQKIQKRLDLYLTNSIDIDDEDEADAEVELDDYARAREENSRIGKEQYKNELSEKEISISDLGSLQSVLVNHVGSTAKSTVEFDYTGHLMIDGYSSSTLTHVERASHELRIYDGEHLVAVYSIDRYPVGWAKLLPLNKKIRLAW
jgi:hypothetical protein